MALRRLRGRGGQGAASGIKPAEDVQPLKKSHVAATTFTDAGRTATARATVCVRLRPRLPSDGGAGGGDGVGISDGDDLRRKEIEEEESPSRPITPSTVASTVVGEGESLEATPSPSWGDKGRGGAGGEDGGGAGGVKKKSLLRRVARKANRAARRGGQRMAATRQLHRDNDGGGDDGVGGGEEETMGGGAATAAAAVIADWETDPDGRTLRLSCLGSYSSNPGPASPSSSSSFSFDAAYPPSTKTSELYSQSVRPVIRDALDGADGLVLLYGPRGGGRTHTLIGTEDDPGVLPLAMLDLFAGFAEARMEDEGIGCRERGRGRDGERGGEDDDEEGEAMAISPLSCVTFGHWPRKGRRRSASHHHRRRPPPPPPRLRNDPRWLPRRRRRTYSLSVSLLEVTAQAAVDALAAAPSEQERSGAAGAKALATATATGAQGRPREVVCGTSDKAFEVLAAGRARLGRGEERADDEEKGGKEVRPATAEGVGGGGSGGSGSGSGAGHIVYRIIVRCRIDISAPEGDEGGGAGGTSSGTRTATLTLVDPLPSDSADADDSLAALEAAIDAAAGSDLWGTCCANDDNDGSSAVRTAVGRSGVDRRRLATMLRPLLSGGGSSGGGANACMVCALPPFPRHPPSSTSSFPFLHSSPSPSLSSLELDASLRALDVASRFGSIPLDPRPNYVVPEDSPEVKKYKEEIVALKIRLEEAERADERRRTERERAIEEELGMSRAEVERLRKELAGAGTVVRAGSGRRLRQRPQQQRCVSPPSFALRSSIVSPIPEGGEQMMRRQRRRPRGEDAKEEVFRDPDEALREQRLRDVEKHVENAILRIVSAHSADLPPGLVKHFSSSSGQGGGGGGGSGSGRLSKGGGDGRGQRAPPSEAGAIIGVEERVEDCGSGDGSGGSNGGGGDTAVSSNRSEVGTPRRSGSGVCRGDGDSDFDWKAVGATGHLLDDDGSNTFFSKPTVSRQSLALLEDCDAEASSCITDEARFLGTSKGKLGGSTSVSLSSTQSPSRYLPSRQLQSMAALPSSRSVRSLRQSLGGTGFGTAARIHGMSNVRSLMDETRNGAESDAASAAVGSLTARLLSSSSSSAAGEEEDQVGQIIVGANDCWAVGEEGTFATARQGTVRSSTATRFVTMGSSTQGAEGAINSQPRGTKAEISPAPSWDNSFHSSMPPEDVNGIHTEGEAEGAYGGPAPFSSEQDNQTPGLVSGLPQNSSVDQDFLQDVRAEGIFAPEKQIENNNGKVGEDEESDMGLWKGMHDINFENKEMGIGPGEEDDDDDDDGDDVLSVVSSAVSSLTSATTLFGHRDHGRDPAVVVGELWRIQGLLRSALRDNVDTGHDSNHEEEADYSEQLLQGSSQKGTSYEKWD